MEERETYYYGIAKTGAPLVGKISTPSNQKPTLTDWQIWGIAGLSIVATAMAVWDALR